MRSLMDWPRRPVACSAAVTRRNTFEKNGACLALTRRWRSSPSSVVARPLFATPAFPSTTLNVWMLGCAQDCRVNAGQHLNIDLEAITDARVRFAGPS